MIEATEAALSASATGTTGGGSDPGAAGGPPTFDNRPNPDESARLAQDLLTEGGDEEEVGRRATVRPQLDTFLDTMTFEVRDARTNELLRHVPPEEMLEAARFTRALGLVLDRQL